MESLLEDFQSDPVYQYFLSDSFDEASIPWNGASIPEKVSKIASGIQLINNHLQLIISESYDQFLSQITQIDHLEEFVNKIHSRIQILNASLNRLKDRFTDPYNKIAHRIVLLKRLHTTCDLLRKIIRFMNLSRRLQLTDFKNYDPGNQSREITKAAQYVYELNSLILQDDSLLRIEIIKNDLLQLGGKQNDILEIANACFLNGFSKQDSNSISVALQVYFSFDLLNEKVNRFLQEKEDSLSLNIRDVFDIQQYSMIKGSNPGTAVVPITSTQSALLKNKFWNNLEGLMEQIFICFTHVEMLFRLLKKKRDPLNQGLLIEFVSKPDGLNEFINKVNGYLSKQMNRAISSSLIKECLEGEYPKLLQLFIELWKKLLRDNKEIKLKTILKETLGPFERAYLSRSVSLLFDAVNVIFVDAEGCGSSAPSKEDIDNIIKAIFNELMVANVELELLKAVGRNVAKAVNFFFVQCEKLVSVDGDATQVIGPPTKSQQLNSHLVKVLKGFRESLNASLANYDDEIIGCVKETLNGLDALIITIIDPLMNSVTDAIEAIILTVHSEDFHSGGYGCSLYMKELQGFISRVDNDYFTMFPNTKVIKERIEKVVARTIDLFLRHITLVRPMDNVVKMRLAADCGQLEEVLAGCSSTNDFARQYKILRLFKPLFFQEPEEIANSDAVNSIPYTLLIQYLISAHCPPELKAAHINKGWSISRYTTWMDENQGEYKRLILFKDSLESYVKEISKKQGVKSFPPIYQIVLQLLQKGLNEC